MLANQHGAGSGQTLLPEAQTSHRQSRAPMACHRSSSRNWGQSLAAPLWRILKTTWICATTRASIQTSITGARHSKYQAPSSSRCMSLNHSLAVPGRSSEQRARQECVQSDPHGDRHRVCIPRNFHPHHSRDSAAEFGCTHSTRRLPAKHHCARCSVH